MATLRVLIEETRRGVIDVEVADEDVAKAFSGLRHSDPHAVMVGRDVHWNSPTYVVVEVSA